MNLFTLGDKDFLITVDYTKIILKWIGLDKDSIIEEDSKRADLRPLSVGQMVRLLSLQRGEVIWKEGRVIQKLTSRSYLIKKKYEITVRRNRLFMQFSTRATHHLSENSKNTLIRSDMNKSPRRSISASHPYQKHPHRSTTRRLDKTQNRDVKRYLVETGRST